MAAAAKARGNKFYSSGQYADAISAYTEAIRLDPSHHVYYSNRAMTYLKMRDWDAALADASKCVEINPKFWKGHGRKVKALVELGDYLRAQAAVEAALKAVPNEPEIIKLRDDIAPHVTRARRKSKAGMTRALLMKEEGNERFKAGRHEEAIPYYTKGIAGLSAAERGTALELALYNNRAACYQQISNHQAMVEDASHVLEVDANNQKALLRRALGFEALERYRSALQDIRHLLSINPNVPIANAAQHRIGQTVRRLKQLKKK